MNKFLLTFMTILLGIVIYSCGHHNGLSGNLSPALCQELPDLEELNENQRSLGLRLCEALRKKRIHYSFHFDEDDVFQFNVLEKSCGEKKGKSTNIYAKLSSSPPISFKRFKGDKNTEFESKIQTEKDEPGNLLANICERLLSGENVSHIITSSEEEKIVYRFTVINPIEDTLKADILYAHENDSGDFKIIKRSSITVNADNSSSNKHSGTVLTLEHENACECPTQEEKEVESSLFSQVFLEIEKDKK